MKGLTAQQLANYYRLRADYFRAEAYAKRVAQSAAEAIGDAKQAQYEEGRRKEYSLRALECESIRDEIERLIKLSTQEQVNGTTENPQG